MVPGRGRDWQQLDRGYGPRKIPLLLGLVQESLAYLTPNWAGALWTFPGMDDSTQVPPEWRPFLGHELTVEVLEVCRAEGEAWFHVRLYPSYGCGIIEGDLPAREGWVPGRDSAG